PSNFVSSTTTSSGTRKMRVMVSEFGRFMNARTGMITSAGSHESDPACRRQGDPAAPADDSYPEADRPDLRPPVPPLSARSPQTGARDRRGDSQPQLPAAPHRGDLRRRQ